MSTGPIMFNKAQGKLGNMVLAISKGQQIARAYAETNNTGGSKASYGQRFQRVKLPNLVNTYRVLKDFFRDAFQFKAPLVSDYNKFASYNLPYTTIYLPKEIAQRGASVIAPYLVTRGTLPQVSLFSGGSKIIWDASLDFVNSNVSANTKISELSTAFIRGNLHLQAGDMITFLYLYERSVVIPAEEGDIDYPEIVYEYKQFHLDPNDDNKVPSWVVDIMGGTSMKATEIRLANWMQGLAVIISRNERGKLLLSTSSIVVIGDYYTNKYSGPDAMATAMQSYGYRDAFLLESQPDVEPTPETPVSTITYSSIILYPSAEPKEISYIPSTKVTIKGVNLNKDDFSVRYYLVGGAQYDVTTSYTNNDVTFPVQVSHAHYTIKYKGVLLCEFDVTQDL